MKVWVVLRGYDYEGGLEIVGVYSSREKAQKQIPKRRHKYDYSFFDIEECEVE